MRLTLCAILLALTSCSWFEPEQDTWGMPEQQEGRAINARFATLVDGFMAWYYASHPVRATSSGIHEHDARLDDVSKEAILDEATNLTRWLTRIRSIDRNRLSDDARLDWLTLESAVRARIFAIEEVRDWESKPGFYREVISGGLHSLASIRFAPVDRRMALATQRLLAVPGVLASARVNLKNPAKLVTEMAVDEFTGMAKYLRDEYSAEFGEIVPEPVRVAFGQARGAAVAQIESFIEWLKTDLLPRSTGAVALGEPRFRLKLQLEEMIDTSPADLAAEGRTLLASTQAAFRATAAAIDPAKKPEEVLRDLGADHPAAEKLLDETRAMLEELKKIAHERLCDVPADAECKVRETPPFRRTTSFASMQVPGMFETVARDAYYLVTLPDPAWDAAKKGEHLRFFNRSALTLISVHEAFPGHYVQLLAARRSASRVRRAFGSGAFIEGWAHYLEEAFVDVMDKPDPKLRLAQHHLALLRICRYLAAIELHTGSMTYEQAVEFFMKEGGLERTNAERESRRGLVDPGYYVYTLGKVQILKLREECRAAWGSSFTLRDFHNRLIAHGSPPVRILSMALLGRRN